MLQRLCQEPAWPSGNCPSPCRTTQQDRQPGGNMKESCTSCWENRASVWLWRARGMTAQSSALQRGPQPWPLYPQEALIAARGQARASKCLGRSQGVLEDQDLLSTRGIIMRRHQDSGGCHRYVIQQHCLVKQAPVSSGRGEAPTNAQKSHQNLLYPENCSSLKTVSSL